MGLKKVPFCLTWSIIWRIISSLWWSLSLWSPQSCTHPPQYPMEGPFCSFHPTTVILLKNEWEGFSSHTSQLSLYGHTLALPLLIRKVFWAARRAREIQASIADHRCTINYSVNSLQIYVWDVSWLLFKPIKKYLLKSGISSADTFLDSLTITLYLASTGLSWQISSFLLCCTDLWAWLSQLKACQDPQISTKTCSMRPGWNNLSAASIFPLVTISLLTFHSKLHLALQSIQTWHLKVAFP